MSSLLAARSASESGAAALAEAQRRFYTECRRAKLALETAPTEANTAWPVGRTPLDSLQDLLQKNKELAERRGFEAIRAKAEREAEAGAGSAEEKALWKGTGWPLYASRAGGEPAPTLALTETGRGRRHTAWSLSWMWTELLLLVGLLSLLRPTSALLRFFWPEQIAIVGLVGWWAAGATWIVLGLLLLAVGARLLVLLVGIGRFFHRPPPDKPKSTANLPAVS